MLFYNIYLVVSFIFFILYHSNVVFSKTSFFFSLGILTLFLIYINKFGFLLLIVCFTINNINIFSILVIIIFLKFWNSKKGYLTHLLLLLIIICVLNIVVKQNFIYFDYLYNTKHIMFFTLINKLFVGSDECAIYSVYNTSSILNSLFKNLNISNQNTFQDFL